MPASVVVPLIVGATSAGASIYGANKAAGANTQAAQTQATANTQAAQLQAQAAQQAAADQLQAAEDALNFEKQVYTTKQGQVAPYIGMGQGALNTLGNWLGVSPVAQSPVSLPATSSGTPAISPTTLASVVNAIAPHGTNPNNAPTIGTAIPRPLSSPIPPSTPGSYTATSAVAPNATQALSGSSVGPASVGEQRYINGQLATWDGTGWSV